MPPRGVRKGSKRAREYQHIKASVKRARCLGEEGRGDRGADGQQGSGARGRVPDPVQGLAARQVAIRPRRPTFGNESTEGSHT